MDTALSQNTILRKKLLLVLDGYGMAADVDYMPLCLLTTWGTERAITAQLSKPKYKNL